MDITFLDLEDVLMIHADQIYRYGGNGALRDKGLLESAIMMPQTSFAGEFAHSDLYEMAAAYLYHVVMNHPFVDGNKRTGVVCALAFLELNAIKVNADNNLLADFVLLVAQGLRDKNRITDFLKENSRQL